MIGPMRQAGTVLAGAGKSSARIVGALTVCAFVAGGAHAQSGGAGDIALVGGRVHTGTGTALEGATVLVSDGNVEAVGVQLEIPAGYRIFDTSGKVITPGLIEPYSQLGLDEIGGEATTVDSRIADYPASASFDVRYALNPAATAVAVNRRDGVTRAVVAPQPGVDPLAGWGLAIRLSGSNMITHTDVGLFGAVGAGSARYVGGSRSAVIQRLREGFRQAANYNAGRYQPGPGDYSHADMAALKRFLRAGVPLVLEVHRANEISQSIALAADFKLKLILRGGTEAWKVSGELASARVPVIVNVLANLPSSYDRLGARLDNAALLHAAGVTVLLTSGQSQNARWLRQVAGNAVAHGLPWEVALSAITRAPAEAYGLGRAVGTLTEDAPADLVVWNSDPLELTSWAEQVMIDGAWQDMSSRQTRLFERYQDLTDGNFSYR